MRFASLASLVIAAGVIVFIASVVSFAAEDGASVKETDAPHFTPGGSLILPSNYREWVFVSAGLGMTYGPLANVSTPQNPGFENVFVQRAAYQTFLKTAKWPDKTTFILEIRSSESKGSINKGGHFQSGVAAVEAEVKDGANWTFYGFGKATEAKAIPRTESCYTCHSQNAASDNTFVQFYPTLFPVAKEKGALTAAFSTSPDSK